MTVVAEAITRVHREEWSRVVAALTRRFGDLDIAEEMAAEARLCGPQSRKKGVMLAIISH